MGGGCVGWRNGMDTGQEVWRTVEMVWTQDRRFGGLYKWSGHRTGGLEYCRNGLDTEWEF
jgi:hypothetical protein